MATPEVSVKISADASGFARGVAVVQGSLASLQKQMTGFQAVASKSLALVGFTNLGVAATAAAAGLVAATKAAADYGDQLDAMSQRTGVAVEDLAKLQYAAKLSDTSAEALGKGLIKLAPTITAAAAGAPESSKLFEKFGIAVRNADGSVRSSYEVLLDLADIFSTMPEGPQKTALAIEFFGKKMGAELIPLLNQGSAGLKAMGDEAERLGLVLNKAQTSAAADFNDNLDRLAASSKATSVAIGNELIPTLNRFFIELNAGKEASGGFLAALFNIGTINPFKSSAENIKTIRAEIEKINADQAESGYLDEAHLNRKIAQLKYLEDLEAKNSGAEKAKKEAAERELMASQLVGKLKQLEKLRAIAAGEASADILKSDKELNDARLKDAEKLRDALRAAYQTTANDAKSAAEDAIKLLDKARAKRTSAADKAVDKSTAGLSEEDKAAVNFDQAKTLFDQGRFYAAAAASALLDKRTKVAEGYQKKADEFLSRAEAFADKSGNSELVGDIAEAQARILEAQAAVKQKEAADLEQRAAAQMAILNEVEAKIKQITTDAANIEIKADLTQLEADVARIKAEIEKGAVMPVTIAPQQAGIAADINSAGLGGFAGGGFTGFGGKSKIAGFVHGMEYVTPAGVAMQPGVIPFLDALRRYGNKVLPGYESGGLVTQIDSRVTAPAQTSSLTLDFGKLGRFQAAASQETAREIERVFKRAALQYGSK